MNFEKYLDVLNIRKYRKAFTKLRVSSHRLNIEVGRHQGLPRENRICLYCCNHNINVIEDEYHFVVKCSLYNYLRGKYIPMVKNLNDYVTIMQTSNEELLTNILCFVYHGFVYREIYLASLT